MPPLLQSIDSYRTPADAVPMEPGEVERPQLEAMFGGDKYVPAGPIRPDVEWQTPEMLAEGVKQQVGGNLKEPIMPQVVAVLAALGGQFGPLMQIYEQRRKTQLSQAVTPHIIKVNQLVRMGKVDEAQSMIAALSSSAGPRSPELGQYLNQFAAKLDDMQAGFADARVLYADAKANITDPDDPRQSQVASLKMLLDTQTPMSKKAIDGIRENLKLQSTYNEGAYRQFSPGSGRTRDSVGKVPARLEQYSDRVKALMSSEFNWPTNDIVNYINAVQMRQPFIVDGVDLARPDSPIYQKFFTKLSELQADEAQLIEARNIDLAAPGILEALARFGKERVARRDMRPADKPGVSQTITQGPGGLTAREKEITQTDLPVTQYDVPKAATGARDGPQPGATQVLEDISERQRRLKEQELDVITGRDPFRITQSGEYTIHVNKNDLGTYLTKTRVGVPLDTVKADPGLRNIPREIYDKEVIPMYNALQAIAYVDQMFDALGNPTSNLEIVSSGISRFAQDYLGIRDKKTALSQVARLAIDRAVEEMAGTEAFKNINTGNLKSDLTGYATGSTTGRQIAMQVAARLRQKLGLHIGRENVPDVEDFGLGEQRGKELGIPDWSKAKPGKYTP
jgi:hypothetical protein